MKKRFSKVTARWLILALIVILQIVVLVISPEEKTLGTGIKPVYLHVSLTWVGMILALLCALLGLGLAISGHERLGAWQRRVFLAFLISFGVGFLVSLYASWLNWGGIPIQEPKFRTATNVLVAGIGAWALREIVSHPRLKGLSGVIPAFFLFLSKRSPRMVLHPDNPVVSSPIGIKGSFYSMFALGILLAIWFLVWYPRKPADLE
jgi:hypothetical protein